MEFPRRKTLPDVSEWLFETVRWPFVYFGDGEQPQFDR
jgi:hypothetical protein